MDRSKLLTDAELLAQAEAENHRLKKTIIETTEENKTKRSKMQAMKERLKSSSFMEKHKFVPGATVIVGTSSTVSKEHRGVSATVTRAAAADGRVTVQVSGGATLVVASSDLSLVPDSNSENVAVLLQEVQGSIPKLKQEQTMLKQQIANPSAKASTGFSHAAPAHKKPSSSGGVAATTHRPARPSTAPPSRPAAASGGNPKAALDSALAAGSASVAKGALLDAVQEAHGRVKMLEQQLKAKAVATGDAVAQTDAQSSAADSSLKAMKAEIAAKQRRLESLQRKLEAFNSIQDQLRKEQEEAAEKADTLKFRLGEETIKVESLRRELAMRHKVEGMERQQLETAVDDLRKELEMLERENEDLRRAAFAVSAHHDPIKTSEAELQRLQQVQKQLSSNHNRKLEEQHSLEQNARQLKERIAALQQEKQRLEVEVERAKMEQTIQGQRMSVYSSGGGADVAAMAQGLRLVGQNITRDAVHAPSDADMSALPHDEVGMRRTLRRLRADNAELYADLERARKMMELQKQINEEKVNLKSEGAQRLDRLREHFASEALSLKQHCKLLQDKNEHLRAQLRQSKLGWLSGRTPVDTVDVRLESTGGAGDADNSLEISVNEVTLLPEAFGNQEPTTLLMLDMYMHPTQTSRPIAGFSYNPSWRRVFHVTIDEPFLMYMPPPPALFFCNHLNMYLHNESVNLELVRTRGTDFDVVGTSRVPLDQLLDWAHGPLPVRATFVSSNQRPVGEVEFSLQLHKPVSAALRGFRPFNFRPKHVTPALHLLPPSGVPPLGSDCELIVTVHSCTEVPLARSGAPAAAYAFYQLPACQARGSQPLQQRRPQWNDTRSHKIHFTSEFASLMLAEPVAFALFDDGDSNPDAFIGRGSLSLAPLLESNQLHVTIPLTGPDGTPAPTLEVSVMWVLPTTLPLSPVLSPVAHQGGAGADVVLARGFSDAGRGMSDSLGSFSATLLKLQVSSAIMSEEELTCFFGVFIFPGETEKEALAHASATKAKAGGWVQYGYTRVFSLDSLQVMTACGGVVLVGADATQAPSVKKLAKQVKQRQPCYLTLVIYDKTEEPAVAVGRMQMSLTEMLNLQVPQLVLTIQSPALTVRQEDVSQRRYVVKDCGVDDDGQTNDFGVVTLDVTALDALQNLARSQDM